MARVTIELDSLEEASDVFAGLRALHERREEQQRRDMLFAETSWIGDDRHDVSQESGNHEKWAPSEAQVMQEFPSAALGPAESVEPLSVPGAGAADDLVYLVRTDRNRSAADDIDTDSAGVVWDAAVHSANRTKNVDGTWRKRRGVETAVPPPPPAADSVPPAPVTAAPNWPAAVQELMPLVTRAMVAGTLTPAAIGEACRSVGITALPDHATRPELIPAMCVALGVVS